MTDSNGDLVEKVLKARSDAVEVWKAKMIEETGAAHSVTPGRDQREVEARAAIAAVLDDLMEPTQLMLNEVRSVGCHMTVPMPLGDMEIREEIRAAVRVKKYELGLESPQEPADAPKPLPGTQHPQDS